MSTRMKAVVAVFLAVLCFVAGYATDRIMHAARIEHQLATLSTQVSEVRQRIGAAESNSTEPVSASMDADTNEQVRTYAVADVDNEIKKLGTGPSCQEIADCLARIDSWTVRPEDEKPVVTSKAALVSKLRDSVSSQVKSLQQKAVEAPSGGDGIRLHGEAGQMLALYPMSDEPKVVLEAKALSARQAEVANRIEGIRRQRYNLWASDRIEAAIGGYNKGSSYWGPKRENTILMDSLVSSLAEVDPGLLEPAVMELYSYVIDLTKGSISELEKVSLAKRLVDPAVHRRTLGDF